LWSEPASGAIELMGQLKWRIEWVMGAAAPRQGAPKEDKRPI